AESRWWEGPDFLLLEPSEWQYEAPVVAEDEDEDVELQKEFMFVAVEMPEIQVPVIEHFSKYTVLVRAAARVLKFVEILKARIRREPCDVNKLPVVTAGIMLLKKAQWDSFPKEMDLLGKGQPIYKGSKLYQLSPI